MPSPCRPTIARSLTLPTRPSASTSPQCLQCFTSQIRHTGSSRRNRKLNNIAPAPAMGGPSLPTGATGRSKTARERIPDGDHIVYNPPSSAPNAYHTPPKFLPKTDIRWKLFEQQQAQRQSKDTVSPEQPAERDADKTLPPPVHTPYQKKYHLLPQHFEEMRELRQGNEEYWTRSRLAAKFGCTQWFAGMVVQASDARRTKLRQQEEQWEDWARRKNPTLLKIREDRKKRKALWTHEV